MNGWAIVNRGNELMTSGLRSIRKPSVYRSCLRLGTAAFRGIAARRARAETFERGFLFFAENCPAIYGWANMASEEEVRQDGRKPVKSMAI